MRAGMGLDRQWGRQAFHETKKKKPEANSTNRVINKKDIREGYTPKKSVHLFNKKIYLCLLSIKALLQ
jgi:hypothetical protein